MPAPLHAIGTALRDVMTPSALISLPALEANEATMRRLLRGTGVALRPHFKAHKSSQLAEWQLRASADEPVVGFCAQTLGEVEALVRGSSVTDIILTNQVSRSKAKWLAALAAEHPKVRLSALVDCAEHVADLDETARAAGAILGALVEIECGQDRCGVPAASDAAVALAKSIVAAEGLAWRGLHVYHGFIQHVRSADDRQGAVEAGPASAARATTERFAAEGIPVPCVTGGGTGTFRQDLAAGTHTELQPGSYLLMDGDYAQNGDSATFEHSLCIHTTVISADHASGKRVVDAGSKACDFVCGMPRPTSISDKALAAALGPATFKSGGDEAGIIHGVPAGMLKVGETLQLIPSHCDPTVNLHDQLLAVRGGAVEAIWPVDGRGPR